MESDIRKKPRFFAYICPACRQSVIVRRTVGELADADSRFSCPCGKSELRIRFQPHQVRLMVPCVYCGRSHAAACSPQAFVMEKALVFSCAASGLPCCHVGEEGPVYAATARLEQTVDKVSRDREERQEILDTNVMEEVLGEIRDIAARGGIHCTCGSRKWTFRVNYSSVDLLCTECGGEMRIPAATAEDITDICCRSTLLIRGRKT